VGYGAALHLVAALRATHYLPLRRKWRRARRRRSSGSSSRSARRRDASSAAKMLPEVPSAEGGGGDGAAAQEVRGRMAAWWAFAALWPVVAYVLPLATNPAGSGELRGRRGVMSLCKLRCLRTCCVALHRHMDSSS
jgi:hypothetical protein